MKGITFQSVLKFILALAMFVALPQSAFAKAKKSGPTEVAIPAADPWSELSGVELDLEPQGAR